MADTQWERRILLFTPTGRDAPLITDVLAKFDIHAVPCGNASELSSLVAQGVGAVLISEEALNAQALAALGRIFHDQPAWSDLPVIVLTSRGDETAAGDHKLRSLNLLGNISLVERPVRPSTLVSMIQSALRARDRQYQFREQAKALEQSNEDLQKFAAVASHDLKEPLRMISTYSQLLARKNDGRLDEDSQLFIRYILNGVDRMGALISDLLTFSRYTSEDRPPAIAVDCNAALGLALQHLKFKIDETEAAISFDHLPVVLGYESRIVQLFQNLLGNALKYCEIKPKIEITARREGPYWVLAIKDNGIGIPPEYRERIFGLFQRLHSHDQYPGTGIGLATCKRIVEQYGGRIWVNSTPGEGSTFFFTAPAID